MTRITIEVYAYTNEYYGYNANSYEPLSVKGKDVVFECCLGFNKADDKTIFDLWKTTVDRLENVPTKYREYIKSSELVFMDEEVKYIGYAENYEYVISLVGMRDAKKKVKKVYYIEKSDCQYDHVVWKYTKKTTMTKWTFLEEYDFNNMLNELNPDYQMKYLEGTFEFDSEKPSVRFPEQKGIVAGYYYEYQN